jgi:Ca-activated chloride channel family protein
MLLLLVLVPAGAVLMILAERRSRIALERLSALHARLAPVDQSRRRLSLVLVLLAVALMAVALARPGLNPRPITVRQEGRDVVFVVDVSLSMLAEDLAPNRLERAKLAIMDSLPTLEGDRLALVAFAGSASVVCPLTRDSAFFAWAVDGLGPASAAEEGTMIGDAIRKVATDVFDPRERRTKDLVLISDGEDQGSFPAEAAAAAGQQGVRIFAVGLGSGAGSRIPLGGPGPGRTWLTYRGQEVLTRIHGDTMRQTALATPGGRYLEAGTGTFDLGQIYRQLMSGESRREFGEVEIIRYQEAFQVFLLAAFLLLVAEFILRDRKRPAAGGAQ